MRIELTWERYATLCVKARKGGLTKRVPIARILVRGEISGYENSTVKRPERVRRFCKAVPGNPRNFGKNAFVGFNKSTPAVPQTA